MAYPKDVRSFVKENKVVTYRYVCPDPSSMDGKEIIVLDQYRNPTRISKELWETGYKDNLKAWEKLAESSVEYSKWIKENIINKLK